MTIRLLYLGLAALCHAASQRQNVGTVRVKPSSNKSPSSYSVLSTPVSPLLGGNFIYPTTLEPTPRERDGCAPPEVLVNGKTVPGGGAGSAPSGGGEDFSSVQEVQFLGIVGPMEQKRICKIKCVGGVWVGPLCTIDEDSSRFQPMLRPCPLTMEDPTLEVSYQGKPLILDPEEDTSLPHGGSLQIRCSQVGLFKLVGNSTLYCRNGQWSAGLPTCLATTAQQNFSIQAPPSILYNLASGDAGVTELGEVVILPGSIAHFDCLFQRQFGKPEWAWTPTHRQYPSGWAISVEDRTWKYRLSIYYAKEHDSGTFTCTTPRGLSNEIRILVKEVECPAIESLDRNRVMAVEGTKMHSKARFACLEGYNLAGSEEITCQASGQWSADPPACQVIQCPSLETEDPHLKTGSANRSFGARVYFSCPTGFRLVGNAFVHCLKNETWSDNAPSCEAIKCNAPRAPSNGRALDNGRYLTGDFVQFTCNVGHIIVGEPIAVCDDQGHWSQPAPACKPACEFPGEPANGHIIPTKFHYDIGEIVLVGCNGGFRLLGSQRLRCTTSGHWSGPLPHCRPFALS